MTKEKKQSKARARFLEPVPGEWEEFKKRASAGKIIMEKEPGIAASAITVPPTKRGYRMWMESVWERQQSKRQQKKKATVFLED